MTNKEVHDLEEKIKTDFASLWKDMCFLRGLKNSAYLMSREGGISSRVGYMIDLLQTVEPHAVVKIVEITPKTSP